MGELTFCIIQSEDDLEHHGILGQKWGVRRYQNKDGTLTSLGKKRWTESRYRNSDDTLTESGEKHLEEKKHNQDLSYRVGEKRLNNRVSKIEKQMTKNLASTKEWRQEEAVEQGQMRSEIESVLNNPQRTRAVGRKTILDRTLAASGGAIATGASVAASIMASSAVPLAAVPVAAVVVGRKWYKTFS